ncbi:hypothetical protein ILUMI_03172 [Ignelater luminosus]|uniref:Uncharacterized protein n=1 Tax=Ignelater luminosus TaxID=2038154 RepID=A0A8K0DGT8_IGNLU|nr:hypothetical protein ILUMI_03172 [Ignelater luminosus]
MWNQYGDDFLKNYDMKIYNEPDNRFAFEKWIIVFSIILILFLVLLLVIRCILRYIVNRENKKRRLSDVGSIISHTPRSTKTSLTPHPHQVTPPLFENDYSFNTYDPDDAISRTNYKSSIGNQNFSYFEDDDDSDIDIYNPNFSGSHHNDTNNHVNKQTAT